MGIQAVTFPVISVVINLEFLKRLDLIGNVSHGASQCSLQGGPQPARYHDFLHLPNEQRTLLGHN